MSNTFQEVEAKDSVDQDGMIRIAGVAKVTDFSTKYKHCIDLQGLNTAIGARILLYANGESKEHEEHVYVTAVLLAEEAPNCLNLMIDIVDSSGSHRFPHYHSYYQYDYGVPEHQSDAYLCFPRKILLNNAADLLPDDTLTLSFVIRYASKAVTLHYILETYFNREDDGSQRYLLLDTPLAETLAEESTYFESLLLTPMIEQTTRRVKIQDNFEYLDFKAIGRYFLPAEIFFLENIYGILHLYVTADKYDIPIITEVSLSFLKLLLSDHDALEVREDAMNYFLDRGFGELWEGIDGEMRVYWGGGESSNGDVRNSVEMLGNKREIRGRIWTYRHPREFSAVLYFTPDTEEQMNKKSSLEDDCGASFDFYN